VRDSGIGLGLAISQQLTQGMGGQIEVESAPGKGSSFHFSIEFDIGEQVAEEDLAVEAPAGLNVLVVDDNEASRDILREYLNSFGYQATLTESGEEALALMDKGKAFDLVLLDWMMPGMTGLDVALAMRDRKPLPKIVLFSSWRMPSSEHESMVDAFLAKPIKPSSLLDRMTAGLGADTPLAGELARARELLDNFDFAGAGPLLAAIDLGASIEA
jgi:CheY-like chemotaxis protein